MEEENRGLDVISLMRDMASEFALRLGVGVPCVKRSEDTSWASVSIRENTIWIGESLWSGTPMEVQRFIIAHEIAHLTQCRKRRWGMFFCWVLSCVSYALFGLLNSLLLGLPVVASILGGGFVMFVSGVLSAFAYSRHEERACDKLATQLVGSDAAASALRYLASETPSRGTPFLHTHPSWQQRIQRSLAQAC